MLIQTLVSTLLQLGVVLLLCWMVYLAMRRGGGFRRFIGLKRAPARAILAGAAIGGTGALLILASPAIREAAAGPGTVIGGIMKGGASAQAIAALAIAAILKTALAEEILFRGLIARRLHRLIGFTWGNLAQAILFGAVHLALALVARPDPLVLAALCLFAGALGWINFWLNERLARGSILPGFAAHAAANLVTYLGLGLSLASAG